MATDRGTVPLSGTAIITVLIDDINDSRPEFLNPIQTVSVLESAEPGTIIANVTAIDRDLNPKLEYHIIGIVAKDDTDRLVPDQEDAFAVNINTGTKACSLRLSSGLPAQSAGSLLSPLPSSLLLPSSAPPYPSAAPSSSLLPPTDTMAFPLFAISPLALSLSPFSSSFPLDQLPNYLTLPVLYECAHLTTLVIALNIIGKLHFRIRMSLITE